MIFEGRVAGIGFFEIMDFTVGEVQEFIKVAAEKKLRDNKAKSAIAFRHALLTAKAMAAEKGQQFSLYEEFPFWSDEEIAEAKVEEYKRRLMGKVR